MLHIVAFLLDVEGQLGMGKVTNEKRDIQGKLRRYVGFPFSMFASNATSTIQSSYKNEQRGTRQHRVCVSSPMIALKLCHSAMSV